MEGIEETTALVEPPAAPETEPIGKVISRDELFALADTVTQRVPCPEWHTDMIVRNLSAHERDVYESEIIEQSKRQGSKGISASVRLRDARAKLVVMGTINEDGSQYFDTSDFARLTGKNARPVSRLFDTIAALSGISDEDVDELVAGFEKAGDET